MATVAPSDNYTEESRRFQEALLNGEPGTENGGLFADKAGYHNKRENLPMPDDEWDYSIEAASDQRGPDDKSAAHDWSFPEAWGSGGDHRRIGKYMSRIQAAFNNRDPRLRGWREVLGCLDSNPDRLIGFDFDKWTTRQPDPSHWGHLHFSEHREFVQSWDNKIKMLQILGLNEEEDMTPEQERLLKNAETYAWKETVGEANVSGIIGGDGKPVAPFTNVPHKQRVDTLTKLDQLLARPAATPPPADLAAQIAAALAVNEEFLDAIAQRTVDLHGMRLSD